MVARVVPSEEEKKLKSKKKFKLFFQKNLHDSGLLNLKGLFSKVQTLERFKFLKNF